MKVILKIVGAACLFFISNQLNAQNKRFRGFYISQSGDTVKGFFPDYKQSNKTKSKIKFVSAAGATPVKLTPYDCLEYHIENYDTYKPYIGLRLVNPIDEGQVLNNKERWDFNDQYDSVRTFLRLVAKTPDCEIYVLADRIRINLFYKLPGAPVQELKFKKYYDQHQVSALREYRQQLYDVLKKMIDTSKLLTSLQDLAYSEKAMVSLFDQLYPGKKPAKLKNPDAGWVLAAGVSINYVNTQGSKRYSPVPFETRQSIAPLLSIGYMAPVNRYFDKYFIHPSLSLFRYNNSSEVLEGGYQILYSTDIVVAGRVNAGMNLWNTGRLRLHVSGGIGIMLLGDNKEITQIRHPRYNTKQIVSEYKLLSMTHNINLTTGVLFKNRFMAIATYNLPSPVANNFIYFKPMYSSVQFGFGYKWN